MKKIGVIVPAGGNGTRMGGDSPKQFMLLGGKPVLAHVIHTFLNVAPAADIVVALPADRFDEWAGLCLEHNVPPHKICEGGATRFHSVQNALAELSSDVEYIAVHDAARPLVSPDLVLRTIEIARRHGTAIPVVKLIDSIRRIRRPEKPLPGDGGKPESEGKFGEFEGSSWPENRDSLRAVQTPQVFRADILQTGYERAAGESFTDDASVVESVGYNVMLCEGERRNIKITERSDLAMADALVESYAESSYAGEKR